ncbi:MULTISPECIES: EAL domain-containing protein [unclassified Bradyrhizobium]|uniref:putative bifunctional diguanylate cyclase/phosphodiesterase n=1 Tax=unclassified Bradyrhizobium TaxID=2631580 RepID=UPI00247A51FD|nr:MULTISPECIES: EAL domain-containing protein [unclassified Bradyrhizobium]WGR70727.1 EAL domain-containing protein [Bradyrhizobium sp. ISRA426]WGR75566.1 EAL domain-containing protein [Bradyrhizobium sp. ISRA430]WGR85969.1 EAL domain-containing protein [Bradyrhizobium sp. ISRA432]
MQLADQSGEPDQRQPSPTISAALIDSLYEAPGTVLTGIVFSAFAATLTALKTGQTLIWGFVPLLILAGAVRAFDLHRYQARESNVTAEQAAYWQRRYQVGALIQAAAIGLWCSTTLLSSSDAVAHMIAVSVTTGIVAGGAGRAYGRQTIFRLQALLIFGPAVVALALHGTPYYIAMSVISAAFLLAVVQLSANLHRIFLRAVVAREREAALASQFDTALNNMPHGLCMFRADGQLAVMNHRFGEMTDLSGDLAQSGAGVADIITACVNSASISAESGNLILNEISDARMKEIVTNDPDLARGRTLSWTLQPMADGGTVVLLEDITERKNAEARISHLARYDELTALPNRVSFRDEIERLLAIAHNAECLSALLFVDLDQFKQVNDTLGHPCGDQLLCAVANRLREMLRPEDFVARFGGDEFVVFQQNIHSAEDAAALARRIVERLSERYRIDNHLVEIGASVGIALTSPEGDVSADTLLKNADMALYRAKADGRGTFCFFRDEMAATVEARRILELDLRKALANEEFELFYQPLVNLKTGRITTCEALLRWNHPVRGTVSPVDIIPVAEDMGLIVDLGRWILRRACMECMKWPESVSVAVNFSPQQFHQRDVLSEIRYALEVSGLPAHRLEIEITESSLLRNTQLTHDILSQLHALGVRISLDDFGTGYSSLSYLHNFPMQKVKIDRSFLEGIDTDRPLTLLRGVARLSADLGMSVVVEGIETNEQLALINADGTVSEGQGYLFSRPIPAVRIRQLLNASHGRRVAEDQIALVSSRSIA